MIRVDGRGTGFVEPDFVESVGCSEDSGGEEGPEMGGSEKFCESSKH